MERRRSSSRRRRRTGGGDDFDEGEEEDGEGDSRGEGGERSRGAAIPPRRFICTLHAYEQIAARKAEAAAAASSAAAAAAAVAETASEAHGRSRRLHEGVDRGQSAVCCSICLSDISDDAEMVKELSCRHIFHAHCLDE